MPDHAEHPLEEAERQAPDDVPPGFADEDSRELDVRKLGNDVFDVSPRVVQVRERKPERLLHLRLVEPEGTRGSDVEGMGGDDERRRTTAIARQFVHVPEIFRRVEIDADLLEGLPGGGRPGGLISGIDAAAGEGHMPRPGVVFVNRPLDQEHFRRMHTLAQHHRD